MTSSRTVVVIGAGASGLAAARAMRDAGYQVTVLESQVGLGGVWSAARAYPGLATQNTKASYSFSDAPMPDEWPEQATGPQMREYLADYARRHGLLDRIRFGVEVMKVLRDGDRWRLQARAGDAVEMLTADVVVLASGVFSDPAVPAWPGRDEFEAAGGRMLLPSDLAQHSTAGRDVVVVGWGKTACDLAVALAPSSRTLTILARSMRWKTPHRVGRLRVHETLMLSRTGDWLLYGRPRRGPMPLRRAARIPPRLIRSGLAALISRHLGLAALGLHPDGQLSNVSSQITPGLLEGVRSGRIGVRRGAGVAALLGGEGPAVRLDSGEVLSAQDLVLGTGYRLNLDLLEADVVRSITGKDGVLHLRRFVHSEGLPGLYLVGWTQNISGLLTAEIAALWAAAHLAGRLAPSVHEQATDEAPTAPTAVPPSSLADLDELLSDLGHPLPRRLRAAQWASTMKAEHYTAVLDAVRDDLRAERLGVPARSGG